MEWDFSPKIINSDRISLEPLEDRLFEEVCASLIPDPDGWYTRMFGLNTRDAYRKEFQDAQKYSASKTGKGFAIRDNVTCEIAGISFFLKMDNENRSLEIGTTNIAPRFRRTHINTSAKLAMMQEAFETLDCIRVSFRVDEANIVSRKSIERLGARFGGVLRNERILPDGTFRNYLFYDIIDSEWPATKAKLVQMISRP